MYNTTYQNGHSAKVGIKGEASFVRYIKSLGWKARKAKEHQDMKHVDYFVDAGSGVEFWVDVKGLKNCILEGRVLIELLNVRGDKGWLYGAADVIAFEMPDHDFLLISRYELMEYVENKMGSVLDMTRKVWDKRCMAPNWYRRNDRMDAITNITLEELKGLE